MNSRNLQILRNFLLKWSTLARNINGKQQIEIIIASFTIVAFLLAANYFTAKPSIELSIWSSHEEFYILPVIQFYKDQNIEFPTVFYDKEIANLFLDSSELHKLSIDLGVGVSDVEILQELKKGRNIGQYLNLRIVDLERHLNESTFVRHFYRTPNQGSFLPSDKIDKLTQFIKKKSSAEEYYIFLLALISSRRNNQNLGIKNNGDIDLKDVVVTIPAPVSKLTETRAGNIIHSNSYVRLLNEIEEKEDRIIWKIPFLATGEFLSLQLTTRDTKIINSDLRYSFHSDKTIEFMTILWWLLFVLLPLEFILFWFKGKKDN